MDLTDLLRSRWAIRRKKQCLIFFYQTVRQEQLWTEIEAFGFSTFTQPQYLGYSSKILGKQWSAEWKLFKNTLKSLPGFLVVNIRKCQLTDATGVLSTPLTSSHTSFSLLFRCKREVKYTNSIPLVIFYRCSLLDNSGNCQKRRWSGCLMDYFPAELIALGVRHSTVLSHTSLATEMNHFFVYHAQGSAIPALKQNATMVIFNKRPMDRSAWGRRVGFSTCHNYPSKGCCSKEATVVWAPNCYLAFSKFSSVPTVPTPSSWLWKGISSAWLDSMANWQWQPWDMWHACHPFAFFSCSPHLSPLYLVSRLLSIFLSFTIPVLSVFVPLVSLIFFFLAFLFFCLVTKVKVR